MKRERGYTLIEIIVTIIILGVLASLALPRYFFSLERMKSAEGVQILTTYLNAHRVYRYEYGQDPGVIEDLDISLSSQSKHFASPALSGRMFPEKQILEIQRNESGTDLYILYINEAGEISCKEQDADPNTCTKLGYIHFKR